MNTPSPEDFERMMQEKGFGQEPAPSHHNGYNTPTTAGMYDPNPYGAPTHAPKPGLTVRGKAALGIGVAVLAGTGLLGYLAYSADVAKKEAIAKELDLKAQALRIEEMKEFNRAQEVGRKSQNSADATRQASIDSCVNGNKGLVGKGYGSPTYRQVIDDCQAQYGGTNGSVNMQTAGSATTTTTASDSGDGTIGGGAFLGLGALAVIALWGARKGTKPTPA
ncbi:hypothetical protein [Streptomyces sp. NPDC056527]|uniref:hypothetical protein n=1 Tax=Streptomyces sp. NPDC056527 TaxID=3345853 RepID=UPI0036BADE2A